MAVAPTKTHFKTDKVLSGLPGSVTQETARTLGPYPLVEPVVIAFWPSDETLNALDEAPGLKALAVDPWEETRTAAWRAARAAVDLLGNKDSASPPAIAAPVVEQALSSLSLAVNLVTGLSSRDHRDSAIHTFRILTENGYTYDSVEIRAWAMANGWTAEGSQDLARIAVEVDEGKKHRVGPSSWSDDVIEQWRSDAGVNGQPRGTHS